jgi:hypothetical protein
VAHVAKLLHGRYNFYSSEMALSAVNILWYNMYRHIHILPSNYMLIVNDTTVTNVVVNVTNFMIFS